MQVNMGATKFVGNDRYPYTIVEILSDKKIVLQADIPVLLSGSFRTGNAKFAYQLNSQGEKVVVTARKDGKWVQQGDPLGSSYFVLGPRQYYQNPDL